MKPNKLFISFFCLVFIGLTNFQNLNSQVENRLEAIGCRLEGIENQSTDHRLQGTGSRSQEEEQQVTGQEYLDSDLNCHLMMYSPNQLAEKVGQSERRVSVGNLSPGQTTSMSSRVEDVGAGASISNASGFKIGQHQMAGFTTSTGSSSAQRKIDPILEKKTQETINKVITDSSGKFQDYYKSADEVWIKRDHEWVKYMGLRTQLTSKNSALTLTAEKLAQAKKAATEEELQKNWLGKIEKYAGIVGGSLRTSPDPHSHVGGMGATALGNIAGAVNRAWAYGKLALTEREHQRIEGEYQNIQSEEAEKREQLHQLEWKAKEQETLTLRQIKQATKELARQLYLQPDWKESQCQAWVTLIAPTWSHPEKLDFTDYIYSNLGWAGERTKDSWQQKMEQAKEQLLNFQRSSNLASVKSDYEKAVQWAQRFQKQEDRQKTCLEEVQQIIEGLKQGIEKRVYELEKLETGDKVRFEQKRKEFIEKLRELAKKQQDEEEVQQKLGKTVEQMKESEKQLSKASEIYQTAKNQSERTLSRMKVAYQLDRELWQEIWLQKASDNYRDWSLPDIISTPIMEDLISLEETKEIKSPIEREEEVERRGRDLQVRKAIIEKKATLAKGLTTVLDSSIQRPLFSKQTSFFNSIPTNLDQVKEWVQERQKNPTLEDQKRWEVLEKLYQLRKDRRIIKKELKELQKEYGGNNSNSHGNNKSQIIDDQSSVNFEEDSRVNDDSTVGGAMVHQAKKQFSPGLTPINEEEEVAVQHEKKMNFAQENSTQAKLRELQEEIFKSREEYYGLVNRSEAERLIKQREAMSFETEADRNDAWEQADQRGALAIQEKHRKEEQQKLAEKQQESWQTNTERWRARAQADQALKALKEVGKEIIELGNQRNRVLQREGKKQAEKITQEITKKKAEEERLEQMRALAEKEWEEMAKKYYEKHSGGNIFGEQSEKEFLEELLERDKAINRCWEKLLVSYHDRKTEEVDPEIQVREEQEKVLEEEALSKEIEDLSEAKIEKRYLGALKTCENQEKALVRYKKEMFQLALKHARNYPEEMVEAWEKIGIMHEKIGPEQQEINKEALKVFREEIESLKKIEERWQGILEEELKEAKQRREEAAQEYYRGNPIDWNALSDQERRRYNSEAKKANEEYHQKKEERNELITNAQARVEAIGNEIKLEAKGGQSIDDIIKEAQNKKQVIETDIKNEKRKTFKRMMWTDPLPGYYEQCKALEDKINELEKLKKVINENGVQLEEQVKNFQIGQKAKQYENYYETLVQIQHVKQQENIANNHNAYWQKAAQNYEEASKYWKESIDDSQMNRTEQQKNEKIAIAYQHAAESFQKAADENAEFLKAADKGIICKGKRILKNPYENEGDLYERLAEQLKQEGGEGIENTISGIEEDLYKADKEIEYYVRTIRTRGVQIETLQNNIRFLQERYTELYREVKSLRQGGQEVLAVKSEVFIKSLHELILSCNNALNALLQDDPESNEQAAKTLVAIEACKATDQQLQQTIKQVFQILELEPKIDSLQKKETTPEIKEFLVSQLEQVQKIKEQLLAGPEGRISIVQLKEQSNHLQQIISRWEQSNHHRNDFISFLNQFKKKKDDLKKEIQQFKRKITESQNKKELLLLCKVQQQLLNETVQVLANIDQTSKQILIEGDNASQRKEVFDRQFEELGEHNELLKKNTAVLIKLGKQKNYFEDRLEKLQVEATLAKNNKLKTYFHEIQESCIDEITQLLSKIDQSVTKLLNNQSEVSAEAKILLEQLEPLELRDQNFQKNTPDLKKLSEKKSLLEDRLEKLKVEVKASQEQQQHRIAQKQQTLIEEINNVLIKIAENFQQVLTNTPADANQIQILFNQIEMLEKRDAFLQKRYIELKELIEKESSLKICYGNLKEQTEISDALGKVALAETQEALLQEIKNILEEVSQIINQLTNTEKIVSEKEVQHMKELISHAEQLQYIAHQLQENELDLYSSGEKVRLLQDRINALKTEINSIEGEDKFLLAQKQKELLVYLQEIFNKASEIHNLVEQATDCFLGQIKPLFLEIDRLEQLAQVKENEIKTQQFIAVKTQELIDNAKEAKRAFLEEEGGGDSYLWDRIAIKLDQSRDSWKRHSELLNQGEQERASLWEKVAKESEDAAKGIKEVIQTYISSNDQMGNQLKKEHLPKYYLSDASTWSLMSKEALEEVDRVGKAEKDFWRKLAEYYQLAASFQEKASEAHCAGEENIRNSWVGAGRSAYFSANYWFKGLEAQKSGRKNLAKSYQEAAAASQKAVDQLQLAAKKHADENWNEGFSLDWLGSSLQKEAEYQVKAVEMQEAGKTMLVSGYKEAAKISKNAADKWGQAAQLFSKRKENEAISWQNMGKSLQLKANCQATMVEVQEAEKTILTAGYEEAMGTFQKAASQWEQAAKAFENKKENEAISRQKVGELLQTKAGYQVKTIEAQEAQKIELATDYYGEAVKICEEAVSQWELAAKAFAGGNEDEGLSRQKVYESLQAQADCQAKAIDAWKVGNGALAENYRNVVEMFQEAVNQFKQAAKIKNEGQESERNSLGWQANSLQVKAEYELKAIEAKEAEKIALAKSYQEAAEISQRAADQYKESVQAYTIGNSSEGKRLFREAKATQAEADAIAKRAEEK
ncbi:MAG TPA: hypothetical protein VJK54_01855 [Chthoniobacterales bacterium]|nr:hypothetical protein [Chthoniobacterales bacterium]